MSILQLFDYLFSLPKTIYFNLHYFPFSVAVRLPILVSYKVKLSKTGGVIKLPETVHTGLVKIGFSGSFALGEKSYFENSGVLQFNGKATFSRGIQLIVGKEGCLEFGNGFRCNSNCIINSGKKVFFGNDCLLAWNITVLDGDGHIIIRKHSKMHEKSIYIGNHVWICPNSVILKGAKVGDGSIIATNTLITKEIKDNDVLVGFTNTILESEVTWKD